eukprot:GHVH01000858.1.p1 GENE.GHVH01000858.1~~GHVH01000858.1.p1  ORF type:complete len:421 (+),score=62.99 GHVH01000858.1:36-1265(+)
MSSVEDEDWNAPPEVWKTIGDRYNGQDPLKHPLFCKDVSQSNLRGEGSEALHAMLEIQKEMVDEDGYGISFMKTKKDFGNEFISEASGLRRQGKRKEEAVAYHHAIKAYTSGLEHANADSGDPVKERERTLLEGTLLANRSQAHLSLGNYGDARTDAINACKKDPANVKAHYRASLCCLKLSLEDESQEYALNGLKQHPPDNLANLLTDLLKRATVQKEKMRLVAKKSGGAEANDTTLTEVMLQRGFVIHSDPFYYAGALDAVLESHPSAPCCCAADDRVPLAIHWTSLVLFPEFSLSNTIFDLCDTNSLGVYLSSMLPGSEDSEVKFNEWDKKKVYTYDNVVAYLEGGFKNTNKYLRFDPLVHPIRSVMEKVETVTNQIPVFHVIPNNKSAMKMFEDTLDDVDNLLIL